MIVCFLLEVDVNNSSIIKLTLDKNKTISEFFALGEK